MARHLGPRTAVIQMANQQFQNSPQVQQLIQYAESGNTQTLLNFAQQYFGQKGIDLNQELQNIKRLS